MNEAKRFEQLKSWSAHQNAMRNNPELNVIDVTPKPFRLYFKHKMPIGTRIELFLWSSVLLVIGLAAATVVGVFLWIAFSILISPN